MVHKRPRQGIIHHLHRGGMARRYRRRIVSEERGGEAVSKPHLDQEVAGFPILPLLAKQERELSARCPGAIDLMLHHIPALALSLSLSLSR
jgi:hypothetical protein